MPSVWHFKECLWALMHTLCSCVWLLCLSDQLSAQAPLSSCGHFVVSGLNVVIFNCVVWFASEMRSDTTSSRTEALQNSLIRNYGVDRDLYWSSEGGACHAVAEKSSPTRTQRSGSWCKQLRQPVWALSCLSQMALSLCLEMGEENSTRHLHCLQSCLRKCWLSATPSKKLE